MEKDAMEVHRHESHRSVANTTFQSLEKQRFLAPVISRIFHSCLLTMLPMKHGHSTSRALDVAQEYRFIHLDSECTESRL